MRPPVNTLVVCLLVWSGAAALATALPLAAAAQEPQRAGREKGSGQQDEGRWVASLAATSGVLLQSHDGEAESCLFANPADATGACPAPGSTPLRAPVEGSDLAIAAFVGANLELLSPALELPTRPRLFVSGEILPTFSGERNVASQGDPGCVRGPEPGDPCARDEVTPRLRQFGEDAALGQGTVVTASYGTLSFGANLGVAFPAQVGKRNLRIKPSFGWFSYEAVLDGVLVDAECDPPNRCTDVAGQGTGKLRETRLEGTDTRRLHAIGPGLDVEMDTGRYGPVGTAIFIGARAYWTFGDRALEVTKTQVYGDDGLPLANQAVAARWRTELDPWIYRAGVGLRLQWLGWE